MSHSVGGQKVRDQGVGRFPSVSDGNLIFGSLHLLTASSCRRSEGFSGVSFIRALIPFMRAPAL